MINTDVVIIGAGQAGLVVSYYLQKDGRQHLIYEKGQIGESWISQRWDSFQLNTPLFMSTLPGLPYPGLEPDRFLRGSELVAYFQEYTRAFQLPVHTGKRVVSVDRDENNKGFIVKTITNEKLVETVHCNAVVVASGIQNKPNIPPIQKKIPVKINQIHTSDYRNPSVLPVGAVLVAGSGQSGCQIAEELLSAGRTVYFCTSKAGRVPRRYRGRDITEWMVDVNFWNVTKDSLEDRSIIRAVQPQVSGIGRYGHTISLQHLAREGAVILGRLEDVKGNSLILGDNAAANVIFADQVSQKFKDDIDKYIEQIGINFPPNAEDPADEPDKMAACASPIRQLTIEETGISTIIWATGFKGDFSWINLTFKDAHGEPIHERGVSPIPGLFFIGFPWLNSRKSGIIYGIDEDARYVSTAVSEYLDNE